MSHYRLPGFKHNLQESKFSRNILCFSKRGVARFEVTIVRLWSVKVRTSSNYFGIVRGYPKDNDNTKAGSQFFEVLYYKKTYLGQKYKFNVLFVFPLRV